MLYLLIALGLLLISEPAEAEERIGFGYTFADDGSCEVASKTLIAEYERSSDTFDVNGRIRTAPSGGDCRKDNLSYDVNVARYFAVGGTDVFVQFGANEQAASAPYALADSMGMVILREDGNALFATNLPAGAAQTITGTIGISREFGPVRASLGYNMVPVDWAMYEDSRTVHVALGYNQGDFSFDVSVDKGETHFGEVSTSYSLPVSNTDFDTRLGLVYQWGVDAIDNGAPMMQYVNGAPFYSSGPPRGDTLFVSITLGYSLD